jgi:parallel beta-helix repeat protein
MDNVVANNNALNNKIGIYLDSSRNNRLYSNNIVDNKEANAYDNSGLNSWDQPPVSPGVTPKATPNAGKPAPGFMGILVAAGLFTAYLMIRKLGS